MRESRSGGTGIRGFPKGVNKTFFAPTGRPAASPILPPAPASVEAPVATASRDPLEAMHRRAAAFFHVRQVGPEELALGALTSAVAGAFVLLAEHPAFGACFGLAALVAGSLATVLPPWPRPDSRLVRLLAMPSDLLLALGLFGGLARHHAASTVSLALVALVLMAWLPTIPQRLGAPRAGSLGLWQRRAQLGVLLVGVLVGRPGPAVAAVVLVGAVDAWFRLAPPATLTREGPPSFWRRMFLEDGSLRPAARRVSIAVALLAFALFPASDLWRF
jgi:hypothetical protein